MITVILLQLIVINMNHFDTLTMGTLKSVCSSWFGLISRDKNEHSHLRLWIDTILLRFPSIAQDIFKELDNKSLIKCRKLSVPVQNFIDNEKFIWIRRMQKYRVSHSEMNDSKWL